jgi:hypothetical protein
VVECRVVERNDTICVWLDIEVHRFKTDPAVVSIPLADPLHKSSSFLRTNRTTSAHALVLARALLVIERLSNSALERGLLRKIQVLAIVVVLLGGTVAVDCVLPIAAVDCRYNMTDSEIAGS